jgi:GNAT superfamily N-acetyltransferase
MAEYGVGDVCGGSGSQRNCTAARGDRRSPAHRLRRSPPPARSDDTCPLGERHTELNSPSIAPAVRGRGVGGRLMDRVEHELERLGIHDLQIAVILGIRDAQRFCERRGFRAGELVLYRFGW